MSTTAVIATVEMHSVDLASWNSYRKLEYAYQGVVCICWYGTVWSGLEMHRTKIPLQPENTLAHPKEFLPWAGDSGQWQYYY
eukprot:3918947-Rhodomonas_salina.2